MTTPNAPLDAASAAPPEACPACGSDRWSTLFTVRAFGIGRCDECRLVFTLGAAADDGAMQYPPFDQRETALVRLLRLLTNQLLRERARLVEGVQAREGGRLLDFGCGSGAFARLMAGRGYDVVGVEPFSLGRPIERPGLRLVRAPLEELRDDLGTFDIITTWQVLEHVPDPRAIVAALAQHLAPGGTLVVSVPNFASWQSRLFGPGWFHLDPPRHLSHFERSSLQALVRAAGLAIIEERTFHFEYGPVGWTQSALNGLLPRRNFLYEFVKDRGALADVSAGKTALLLAASFVAGAGMAGPSVLLEMAAGLGRAGAVLTVTARHQPQ